MPGKTEVWLSEGEHQQQARSIADLLGQLLGLVVEGFVTVEDPNECPAGASISINGHPVARLKVVYCPKIERTFLKLEDARPEPCEH